MRVYGVGNSLGMVKIEALKKAIGDKLIKIQVMMVDNRILESNKFKTNVRLEGLLENLCDGASYIINVYEEEDGYTIRGEKMTSTGIVASEYKIVEVL